MREPFPGREIGEVEMLGGLMRELLGAFADQGWHAYLLNLLVDPLGLNLRNVRFDPGEVAFLFLPEDDHARARQFFVDARVGHTGPDYLCPYIDPRWETAQIQDALSNLPDAPALVRL